MRKFLSIKTSLFAFFFGISFVFLINGLILAWTTPTSPPPQGNVPPPLNTGPQGQSKEGGLILNTGGASIGLIVDKGKVGFGTTNPQASLEIAGVEDPSIRLHDTLGNEQEWEIKESNGNLHFNYIAGSGGGKIYLNGKVGIGTTQNPSMPLMVEGNNGAGYTAWFRTTSNSPGVGIGSYGNYGGRIQGLSSTGGAANLYLQPAGGKICAGGKCSNSISPTMTWYHIPCSNSNATALGPHNACFLTHCSGHGNDVEWFYCAVWPSGYTSNGSQWTGKPYWYAKAFSYDKCWNVGPLPSRADVVCLDW